MAEPQRLKTRLDGKAILFVDDTETTVGNYMDWLEGLGVVCKLERSLDAALALLEDDGRRDGVGMILLDLDIEDPPVSQVLRSQSARLHLSSQNMGQALGQVLWTNRTQWKLPYCYFSGVPQGFVKGHEFERQSDEMVLNKAKVYALDLPDALLKVLDIWDKEFLVAAVGGNP